MRQYLYLRYRPTEFLSQGEVIHDVSKKYINDMENVVLDAKIHALGGTHLNQSMSLHDVISLDDYHTKNKIQLLFQKVILL